MKKNHRGIFHVDQLETRSLLTGPGPGFGFGFGITPIVSAAVQADLAKIDQDQTKLQTDYARLHSTIVADYQAIDQAIANSTSIKTAQAKLAGDQKAAKSTIDADWQAINSAKTVAERTADFNKLKVDVANTSALIRDDFTAVQKAVANDPAVQAAKMKLRNDQAPIMVDQETLRADYVKLFQDVLGQASGTKASAVSSPIPKKSV